MTGAVGEPELASDCTRCFGLCCVLLPFRARDGFGADKDGGTPCAHLDDGDGCDIHSRLRESGWPGCAVFECFGAGQQVSQVTYRGDSWRARDLDERAEMAAVFSVMRVLHEMLVHLAEVGRRAPDPAAEQLYGEISELTRLDPVSVLGVDLDDLHRRVGDLLRAASRRVRRATGPAASAGSTGPDRPQGDLAGQDLRSGELRDADLRGAVLIATDLRELDLGRADLLGADLRDADVRGCDLSQVLFLTQPQVNAARGDAATAIPAALERPAHWAPGPLPGT